MKTGPSLETYLLEVVRGKQTGFKAGLILFFLGVLEIVYRALVKLEDRLSKKRQLPVPVISVGNLTAGGTGKTPTVVWVVETLLAAGFRPAVLTRGYGGRLQKTGRLITAGDLEHLNGAETGDEPYLLARLLPQTLIAIGRDRYRMGRLALEADPRIDVLVLDDGFQFFRLRRELDLVLLDAANPFDNRHLLPRGLLREPLTALRRAGIVLLTRTGQVSRERLGELTATVQKYNPRISIAEARAVNATVVALAGWGAEDTAWSAPDFLAGRRIGLLTAIGNPAQLQLTLQSLGAKVSWSQVYPDHYVWNDTEVAAIIAALKSAGVNEVITTAKDAVKLIPFTAHFQGNNIGCYILSLEFKVEDPAVRERLFSVCRKKG